jgi:hypothetical protein
MQPFTRAFALVPDCHARPTRYSSLWRRHFEEGLAGAVAVIALPADVDFTWARPAATAPGASPERARVSEQLWHQIRAARPDVVISYCFASDVDPELVKRTIESGVPWVNFFCDGLFAFERVEPLARAVSLNWFPEGAVEARYRALGRPALCRPYALNPAALPESVCQMAVHPVGFVGEPFANRVRLLAELRLRGCPVSVRGEGWVRRPGMLVRILQPLLRAEGSLGGEELPGFVSSCRVVLGLNDGPDLGGGYRSYMKSRDIEFPGYGACYLTQHNEDVARAFDIGREVLTFRTVAEAAARARELGKHPARARAMGLAGRRRVLAEHTWATRLRELAQAL